MSIASSIGGLISKGVSTIGGFLKSPVGGAIAGGIIGGPTGAILGSQIGSSTTLPALPGSGARLPLPSLSGLPGGFTGRSLATGTSKTVAGMIGAPGSRGYSTVINAASRMCLKFPQWCTSVGGTQTVASMMWSGQLPIPKRRRRRGITPKDLSSFRRVASLIKSYGPVARKVPSSCAPRKHCRTPRR